MSELLPPGVEFIQMMSSNDFLYASIYNVIETLVIAIILVILVVYFFLQDFKSTLIPSIAIIVSLIGTLQVRYRMLSKKLLPKLCLPDTDMSMAV